MAPASSTTENSTNGPPVISVVLGIFLVLVIFLVVHCFRHVSYLRHALEARGVQSNIQPRGSLRTYGLRREILNTFPIVKYGREFEREHYGPSQGINLHVLSRQFAFGSGTKKMANNDNDEDHTRGDTSKNANDGPGTNTDPEPLRNNTPKSATNNSRLQQILFESRSCKSLPTKSQPEQDKNSCAICAEGFVEAVHVRKLPCKHIFHPPCIDIWLMERSATCPLW
jgi:hypothetical protein